MSIRSAVGTTLRLALPLYVSTVLLGLVPTAAIMLGVGMLAADRPWRADLLGPGWLNLAAEIAMTSFYVGGLPGVPLVLLALVLVLPLAMLAQLIAYSYLAGGILASLSHAISDMKTDRQPSFRAACREWFWPSFRLSMLGGVLVAVAAIVGAVVANVAGSTLGPDLSLLVQQAILALVLGWTELARAWMVTTSERSVGRGLEQATRAMIRPVALVAWLLLAVPGLALTFVALLPPAVADPYSPLALVQALLFGQVVAFLAAWTKVVRLAVAVRLVGLIRPTGLARPSAGPAVATRIG